MAMRTHPAEVLLRRAVLFPAMALLLFIFVFEGTRMVSEIQKEQAATAQSIADLLAMAVADGVARQDMRLFQAQVNGVILAQRIQAIDFVSIKPKDDAADDLLKQASRRYISRYASVDVVRTNHAIASHQLIGYVVTTIDLAPQLQRIRTSIQQQLVFVVLILLVLWLGLRVWARRTMQPLTRLSWVVEQMRQGHPVVASLQNRQSAVKEFVLLEREMDVLSAQMQDMQKNLRSAVNNVERMTQREKLARTSRDHFQSMITHELKTPLNAIWGGVQLLRAEPLTATQADSVRMIGNGSQNLSKLLDQILAMLGLEQGRIVLHPECFDPTQTLTQLAEEFQRQATGKQLRMEVDIDHGQVLLEADLSKIRQILTLLLDNAIKFTEAGHVRLHSWIEADDGQRSRWFCAIEDSGIGIDPSLHEEVFKPFFQGDSAHSRRYEGAGMGLALAQRLAQIMDGELRIDSQLNQGSCFTLSVSLLPWQQNAPDQQLISRRVLVFETGLAGELARLLSSMGLNVHRVTSIDHAAQLCHDGQIDAVVICMHVNMSVTRELIEHVRHATEQHVVVIQSVERDTAEKREQGQSIGIDHWLRWPSSRSEILRHMARWIA